MSTLYLDRKNLHLSVSSGQLVVREPEAKIRRIPLKLLDRLVIRHATQLESSLLGVLAEAGVALLCLSARNGRRTAMVLGAGHNDARRRLAQYRLSLDEAVRLRLAKELMAGKVAAQQRLLQRAAAEREDLNFVLRRGSTQLQQRWRAIWRCDDLDSLRGQEGAAAAAYFKAYQALFAPSLEFNGRNRRPPRDPVNGVLSLGYTLLHFNAVQAAHGAGLDPLLGFYHEPSYGRESLACDLMEPLRPRLDRWVWQLFRQRVLLPEHFVTDKGACLLNKAGRQVFYPRFEVAARLWRRYLRQQSYALAKALLTMEAAA